MAPRVARLLTYVLILIFQTVVSLQRVCCTSGESSISVATRPDESLIANALYILVFFIFCFLLVSSGLSVSFVALAVGAAYGDTCL